MMENWFAGRFGGEQTLDAVSNALTSAYAWTREWQALLAGLLVLVGALVVARAIRKAAEARAPQQMGVEDARLDLRLEPWALAPSDRSGELVRELEQLRSLIRSALSAFTLTAEQENSPVQFLCQRVARLRPERFPLSAGATKVQLDHYAALLEQLEALRQQLKREAKPVEISGTLVQLNASARSLVAALAPQAANRRHVASEQR